MADRLDEIRARRDAATPGEWRVDSHSHLAKGCRCLSCHDDPTVWQLTNGTYCEDVAAGRTGEFGGDVTGCEQFGFTYADAEFIAASWADVGWLLEHIEQQRVEVERLQEALNRRHAPPSSEWLTKLHDRAHQQMQSRVWRTVDTLVHQVDAERLRATELRAQRQAVLDLCDAFDPVLGRVDVVSTRAVRAALGAADER